MQYWVSIGPRGFSEQNLKRLIEYNPDGIRINLSRTSYEWALKTTSFLVSHGFPEGRVFWDIGNSKPRIQLFEKEEIKFTTNETLAISSTPMSSYETITSDSFFKNASVGDVVVMGDGVIYFVVTEIEDGIFYLRSKSDGILKNLTSLSIEGKDFSCFYISEEECTEINAVLQQYKISLIISFTENAANVIWCRNKFNKAKVIMPKIETEKAFKNMDEILDHSELILIGRGDLALSVGIEKIGLIQRNILLKAETKKKPVIVTTETLDSLFYRNVPLRSEIIDITNSYFSSATGIMLTTQTAASKTPFFSIDYLLKVINFLEEHSGIF